MTVRFGEVMYVTSAGAFIITVYDILFNMVSFPKLG